MPVRTEGWYQRTFINPLSLTSAHTSREYIQSRGLVALETLCPCSSFTLFYSNVTVRRYNSNAETPLTGTGTVDITFIHVIPHQFARDKGGEYMTLRNDRSRRLLNVRFNFAGVAVIFYSPPSSSLPRFTLAMAFILFLFAFLY